jgi:hypothetical protein
MPEKKDQASGDLPEKVKTARSTILLFPFDGQVN